MKPVLILTLAALLSACASLKPDAAPGCQGPRRSANPFGSVLGGAPVAETPAPTTPKTPAPNGCGGPAS